MGRMYARWLIEQLGDQKTGKVLEVRGLPGNSVDRERHEVFREVMEPAGDWDIVEVVGNWDDGTAQKVTADAIAVHSFGTLVDSVNGKKLNSPNDVDVKSDGTVWFTDATYGIDGDYAGYVCQYQSCTTWIELSTRLQIR